MCCVFSYCFKEQKKKEQNIQAHTLIALVEERERESEGEGERI